MIAASVLFFQEMGIAVHVNKIFMPILVYCLGFLMVSNVRYQNFKEMTFFRKNPFEMIVAAVAPVRHHPDRARDLAFVVMLGYMISGPVARIFWGKRVSPEEAAHQREGTARQDGRP